jgi:hypothetical protein
MLRTFAIVAAFALAAGSASAQKIDKNGKCHGSDGKFAKMEICKGAAPAGMSGYKLDDKGNCHGPDGKMAKKAVCKK